MSSHSLPVDSDPTHARWHELEDLLDELALESKSALTADAFYRQLLARIVPAVGACGGAIWSGRGTDELRLESQVNLAAGQMAPNQEVLGRHQSLVEDVLRAGEPRTMPPDSAAPSGQGGGASSTYWLIFHPFQTADAPGVIELLGRREMTAAEAREYVRILAAVVEFDCLPGEEGPAEAGKFSRVQPVHWIATRGAVLLHRALRPVPPGRELFAHRAVGRQRFDDFSSRLS